MNSARFLIAVLLVVGATLAACSGNFGSGTTPPNGLLPSGNLSGISPTPSPTPNSASNIVTYGTLSSFQPLPSAAGYGGAIAFPVPSPKPSGFSDIAIGATLSLVSPSDAPDLNLLTKGKKGVKRERRARPLAYLTLIPTHDATLSAFPRIAIDVPRDIVTIYHENEFGMALYNSGTKDTKYALAVAEIDAGATPPPTPSPNPSAPARPTDIPLSASPSPSPGASGVTPSPSPRPSGAASATASGSASAGPSVSPTLPPQRITFVGTATPLKLVANHTTVFALYAMPVDTPSPVPSGKKAVTGKGKGKAEPEASASADAGVPAATEGSVSPALTSPSGPAAPKAPSNASPASELTPAPVATKS
jgi:hypothetical protein